MNEIGDNPSAGELTEIGAKLSAARQERGKSVADVSASLRLVPSYIEAIENGDMAALPSAPYIVGYVRSYAHHLGLDPAPLCRRLHASLGEKQIRPEYTFIGSSKSRRNGAGRMAFAAMTVLMLGYGGWYAFDAGLVAPLDTSVPEDAAGAAFTGTPGSNVFDPLAESEEPPQAGLPAAQPGTADVPGRNPAAGPGGLADTEAGNAASPPPSAVPPGPGYGQAVASNRNLEDEMVIKAVATSWVEISRPDGSIVASWLMREGDEYLVPGDQDIYLTAGNAGGLEIEIAGRDPLKLGDWGETVSELPLDPTLLSDRY